MAVVRFSEGWRKTLANASGVKAIFDGVFVGTVYSGTMPSNPNNAATGTKLGVITLNGDGTSKLTLDPVSVDANGRVIIAKPSAATWRFTGLANGVAGYCRFHDLDNDNPAASSTNDERFDVQITQSGGMMNMSNLNVVTGAPSTVNALKFVMVPSHTQ